MPPDLLLFSRNRCTDVEVLDKQTLRASCCVHDTLWEGHVRLTAELPDLNITEIRGEVERTVQEETVDVDDALQSMVGIRIGPGVLKIIQGMVGEETLDHRKLAFMVEECCHAVILSFTKDVLKKAPRGKDKAVDYYADMVKENIRLYNRCAAFAPGSALVEGIEPPEE